MKIKLENVIILIEIIIFTICLTIMNIHLMPFLSKTFTEYFGPFFGQVLATVLDYGLISLIVICVIVIREIIRYKYF